MVRIYESESVHPSITMSLLNHWTEFNQTCYLTYPHSKGVWERVQLEGVSSVANFITAYDESQ